MRGAEAPAPTVGSVLRRGIERLRSAGSERPRLDAELLLGHVLGIDRTAIVAHPERDLDPEATARFDAALERRGHGEPVAYIRGIKEFFGLTFRVDGRALIPRPETERLVELATGLAAMRIEAARSSPALVPVRIADIGTGSGAIVVAVADALRRRRLLDRVAIVATERSREALSLAAENLAAHGLSDVVALVEADLVPDAQPAFDVVLANLPYIPSGEIPRLPVAASFEPRDALDGGVDGLAVIRRLLVQLPRALVPGGTALLEIGADQESAIHDAVQTLLPGWGSRVEPDLSGLPRVAVIDRDGSRSDGGRSMGHRPSVRRA